jgi:hypothetical protein
MKYIFTIFAIVCLATILTIYFVWPEKPPTKTDIALTVNGLEMDRAAVAAEGAKAGYHLDERDALLDSLITRVLLIQEAQRQKIDKEESFRAALKTFYEQSLIKILMDRQYNTVAVEVDEEEIDQYLSFFGKTVTFTRLPVNSIPPYKPTSDEGVRNEVLFDDLAGPLKYLISCLTPGDYQIKFDTGNEQHAIRLDSVTPASDAEPTVPDRETCRNIIEDHKRQQQITIWLNELCRNASITIHNG